MQTQLTCKWSAQVQQPGDSIMSALITGSCNKLFLSLLQWDKTWKFHSKNQWTKQFVWHSQILRKSINWRCTAKFAVFQYAQVFKLRTLMSALQNWASYLSRKKISPSQSRPFHASLPPGRAMITAVHMNLLRCARYAREFSSVLTMYSSYLYDFLPIRNQKARSTLTCEIDQNMLHWRSSQEPFCYNTPVKVSGLCAQLSRLYTVLRITVLTLTPKFLLKLTEHLLYTTVCGTNGQESWKTKEDGHKEGAERAQMRRQWQWPQRAKDRRTGGSEIQWTALFGKAGRKLLNKEILSLQGKTKHITTHPPPPFF